MTTTALIDADIILYRAAFAGEKVIRRVYLKGEEEHGYCASFPYKKDLVTWLRSQGAPPDGGDLFSIEEIIEVDPLPNILHTIKVMLEAIMEATGAKERMLFLSPSRTFRHDIYPEYKAGRSRRPIHKDACTEYLKTRHGAGIMDNLEADDCLGIHQKGDTIICSIDKDLLMIPGRHYNITTGEISEVTPEEGALRFYKQVLTGDSTDNIKGLKGIGPKRASAMVAIGATLNPVLQVMDEYAARSTQEHLDQTARLIWISRHEEDYKLKGFEEICDRHLLKNWRYIC